MSSKNVKVRGQLTQYELEALVNEVSSRIIDKVDEFNKNNASDIGANRFITSDLEAYTKAALPSAIALVVVKKYDIVPPPTEPRRKPWNQDHDLESASESMLSRTR